MLPFLPPFKKKKKKTKERASSWPWKPCVWKVRWTKYCFCAVEETSVQISKLNYPVASLSIFFTLVPCNLFFFFWLLNTEFSSQRCELRPKSEMQRVEPVHSPSLSPPKLWLHSNEQCYETCRCFIDCGEKSRNTVSVNQNFWGDG